MSGLIPSMATSSRITWEKKTDELQIHNSSNYGWIYLVWMPKKCNKIITTKRTQILVTMIKCPNWKPTIAFKKILIVWSSDRSITYHIYTSDNEISVIKTHTFVSILWHIKAVFLHFVWEFSQVMEIKEKWMADNWPSQIPCSPWQG